MTTTTPQRFDTGLVIAERIQSNKVKKLERYRFLTNIVADDGELTGKLVDELSDILSDLRIHHSDFTADCEFARRIRASADHKRTPEQWAERSEAAQSEYEAAGAAVKAARESLAAAESRFRTAEFNIRNEAALRNSLTNERLENKRLFGDAAEYVEQHTGVVTKATFTH